MQESTKPKGKLEIDTTQEVGSLRWRMNLCDQIAEAMMCMSADVPKKHRQRKTRR